MTTDVIIDPNSGLIYWNNGSNNESISIGGNASDQIIITGYNANYSPGSIPTGATNRIIFQDSASGTLIPGANGYDLGSASFRWALYSTTGNFSSTIRTTDITNSTDRSTGSIVSAGGLGISLNASIGGTLFFSGTGNSTHQIGIRAGLATSTRFTYTLPNRAPIGIGLSILTCNTAGNMSWISNSVYNGNQYEIPFYFESGSGILISGSSNFKNETNNARISIGYSTESGFTTSGALIISGGIGISKSASIGQTLFIYNNNNNGLFTGLRSTQSGISTVYTLPSSTPSIGTSSLAILNSSPTGGLSWTAFYPNITKSVTILSPQVNDKVTLFYVDTPIQINKVQTVVRGISGTAVSWYIYHGLRDQSTTSLFTSFQTTNNTSVGNTHISGFNDNTVEANRFVWVELINVATGTSEFHMTVFYPHS